MEATLPAQVAEGLVRSVAVTPPEGVGENGGGWGVLVRATTESEAGNFQVEHMEYCACSLINRREFTRMLEAAARQVRSPELAGTRQQFIIDVRSDSTGAIVEKRLHRSTGNLELDRMAMQIAERMRVAPPLLNRRPLEMWSRIPVSLAFPAAAEPRS